jgi:uncharacterized protein DUF1566
MLLALTAAACARARFVGAGDGIALDRRTGLEWTSRDHEQPLNWDDADRYCRELSLGGRPGWRLPELAELQALYDPALDEACGSKRCRLDPAIHLSGPYVWTVTARGAGTRFYYDFGYGNGFSPGVVPTLVRQTICVRTS